MDSAFYAAATALVARNDALDSIASNLANTSTKGFRGQNTTFGSVLAGYGQTLNSVENDDINSYGVLGSPTLNLSQGTIERTGNDLDVAVEGSGFLKVQVGTNVAYTRNGSLKISTQGQLTTQTGDPILGDSDKPISIPKGAAVTISTDGTVVANGAIAGRLKVVEFAGSTNVQSMGNTYYSAPPKSELASTNSQIRQGMLEGSNVDPVSTVVQLIDAQRSSEGMRHALTMIDSEMDKTAATDLARTS
jgi:flagellar basal-body rod protein FlgF